MEPSTCPWCGLRKKVYVRAGSELVCIDCVEKDAAMDATWNERRRRLMDTGYCVECGQDFNGVENVRDRSNGTVHRACELTAQALEATWMDGLPREGED